MATQIQFSVFKAVYDDESQRYAQLASRAQLYLTLLGIYLGAIGFKLKDLSEFATAFGVPLWLFLVAGALVAGAMLSTIVAIRVRDYEAPCDLTNIIEEFGDTPPSDEAFLDDRMVDYAVAAERNYKVNNKVGSWLGATAWLLFCIAVWHVVIFIYALATAIHKQ